jgi:hypothetical protein
VQTSRDSARFEGSTFRIYQRAMATVRHVLGEFYWKVTVGENVHCADYIAPPDMLSVEVTRPESPAEQGAQPSAREANYSLGTYVPHAEIEQAFGVKNLPRGFGVAPNQPAPVDRRVYLLWVAFVALLVILDVVFGSTLKHDVDQFFFFLCLVLVSVIPGCTALYAWSFEKSRWADSQFNPYDTGEGDDDDDDDS